MIAIQIIQAPKHLLVKENSVNFFGLNFQLADHHSDPSKPLLPIQNVLQAKPLDSRGHKVFQDLIHLFNAY